MRLAVLATIALVLLAPNPSVVFGISTLCFGVAGASLFALIKQKNKIMSDSNENESSGSGCGIVLICGAIGCLFGPIGAIVGIGIGLLLAGGSGPKTSETASSKEELTEGGLPYEIEATWNGVSNQEAKLTIHNSRLRLKSGSSA